MIKNLNFSLILLIFLILQISFSQDEFCKTDQNDLIVPEAGCTLIQSEETLVKEILLYGELKINRRNHLKYESIKVKSEKAGIQITSEYEKIVIEDISTDVCDFATVQVQDKINLNFASSAKNELFDIEYMKPNTYKVVNRLTSILTQGVSVIIFNEFEYKLTQIIEISGENVIVEDELVEKESSIYKKSGTSVSKIYHKMLLFDDNRIIFKNNCLRFYSNQNEFGPSHGVIFLNLRALKYETDMQRDLVNIFDIIVFDSLNTSEIQSNIQIQANIKDIILMGQGKSIQLTSMDTIRRLFIIHQQIFKIRIDVNLYNEYNVIDTKIYGSNGQIQFPFQIYFKDIIFANSKLDFEMEGGRFNVDFINGVLTQSSRLNKMTNIHQVHFINFVLQQQLNFSLCNDCALMISQSIFDGTDLNGAIRVEKGWFFAIRIKDVQFFNFEKSKHPLIYSLTDQDTFQKPFSGQYDHAVLIYSTTFAFDKTNKKLINLEQITFITDYFNNNWSRYLVSSLDEKLYQKKNHLKYKDPFFSEKQLNLFEDENQSYRTLEFQMKDGSSLYDIVVEIQNGKTSYNFNEKIHILGYYEYNIYFKLKENKVAPTKQDLKILSIDFSVFVQKKYQIVRIFFDSQQPLQDISIDKKDEIFLFNELDNSIQINFNKFKNNIDYDFTLQFCNKGQVIENHQCVSSCSDKTINPILGVCFDQTKPHPRYYQTKNSDNKIDLNSCSWYCIDCKNNSTCDSCVKNSVKNNCRDENEGEFVSSNQEIEQCEDNCKRCGSKQNCFTCKENMGVDDKGICKPLMSNQYIEYSIIQNCPNQCKKCYSKEFCSECIDGYQQILGKCIKKCEFGYFQNGESCEQCSSNEKKCDDEINKTCYLGYVLNQDKQECEKSSLPEPRICDEISCYPCSIKGYYFSLQDQKCLKCNKMCSECKNDADQCTSCAKNYYFSVQDQKCLKCNEICSECKNDANQCTSCAKGYLFIDGVCSQCPELHIQINNSCQKCSSGYFSDKIKNECHKCNSKCKECISSDICISCNKGFYLENQQCLPCNENCKECKDFTFCLSCLSEDFQLQQNTCIKLVESDSDQNLGMIIGIILGSIFGALIMCLCIFIAIKRQRQKKQKRINSEISSEQADSKVKIDQEQIQNNIPTIYNIQSLENLETQQIILPAEQNKEIQTITSI